MYTNSGGGLVSSAGQLKPKRHETESAGETGCKAAGTNVVASNDVLNQNMHFVPFASSTHLDMVAPESPDGLVRGPSRMNDNRNWLCYFSWFSSLQCISWGDAADRSFLMLGAPG